MTRQPDRISGSGHHCGHYCPQTTCTCPMSGRKSFVEVEIPIRIESTLNKREHWAARHRRAKAHDEAVTYSLIGSRAFRDLIAAGGPYLVTITRIAPRLLDDDNAVGGSKNVRDSIARLLGIDDGDARITWKYEQEKRPQAYAARVRIERRTS